MSHLRLLTAVVALGLLALPAVGEINIPLRQWVSPIYWSPAAPDADEFGNGRRVPLSARETLAASAPLPFVAITPCRIADTRDGSYPAGYGPPQLAGGGAARTFVIPSGPCPGIPTTAGAFSLNFTVVAPGGTPPGGYLSVWPTGSPQPVVSTLNFTSGSILANAAIVPAGTGGGINLFVNFSTDLIIDINGYYAGTGLVTSVNTLTGDLTLAGGSNVTITPAGQTLNISATIPAGAGVYGKPGDPTLLNQGYTEVVPFDREAWAATSMTNVPSGRFWHCSVWTGTKMFVWGGQDADQVPRTLTGGLYDPATNSWTSTSTGTGVPTARRYHHCVWTGSEVLVWGGEDASLVALNDGSRYNPVGDSWTAMQSTGAPAGRFNAAVVWAAEASPPRMLVWGGLDRHSGSVYPPDGGTYNPANNTWSPLSAVSQPTPRAAPVFVWTGTKLVLWGGYIGGGTCVDTGGRYDPGLDTWASMAASPLGARYSGSAVWTGSRMIVWGGTCASRFGDGASYDPGGDSWTPITNTGAPTARYNQVAVWTGSRMIVWSGHVSSAPPYVTNTGGIYDPSSDTWRATPTSGAPAGDYGYRGHWTGLPLNEMVVWGGVGSVGGTYRTLSLFIKN